MLVWAPKIRFQISGVGCGANSKLFVPNESLSCTSQCLEENAGHARLSPILWLLAILCNSVFHHLWWLPTARGTRCFPPPVPGVLLCTSVHFAAWPSWVRRSSCSAAPARRRRRPRTACIPPVLLPTPLPAPAIKDLGQLGPWGQNWKFCLQFF